MVHRRAVYSVVVVILMAVIVIPFGSILAQDGKGGRSGSRTPVVKCDNQGACDGAVSHLKLNGYDLKDQFHLDLQNLSNFVKGLKGDKAKSTRYLAANVAVNALNRAGIEEAVWQDYFEAAKDDAALESLVNSSTVEDKTKLLGDLKLAAALGLGPRGLATHAKVLAVKQELKKAGVRGKDIQKHLTAQWKGRSTFEPMLQQSGIDPASFWEGVYGFIPTVFSGWGFEEPEIVSYFGEPDQYGGFGDYKEYGDYSEYEDSGDYGGDYAGGDYGDYSDYGDYGGDTYGGDYVGGEYGGDYGGDYVGGEYGGDEYTGGGDEYTGGGGDEYTGGGDEYTGGGDEYTGGGDDGGGDSGDSGGDSGGDDSGGGGDYSGGGEYGS